MSSEVTADDEAAPASTGQFSTFMRPALLCIVATCGLLGVSALGGLDIVWALSGSALMFFAAALWLIGQSRSEFVVSGSGQTASGMAVPKTISFDRDQSPFVRSKTNSKKSVLEDGTDGRVTIRPELQELNRILGPEPSARFVRFFRDAPVGIAILSLNAVIHDANTVFGKLLGVDDPHQKSFLDFISQDNRAAALRWISTAYLGQAEMEPLEVSFGEQSKRTGLLYLSPFDSEEDAAVIAYLFDNTSMKDLEVQFAQSQKLQAVGQLAGGIAHDFNNLLTALIGFSDLLLQRHPAGDPSFSDIMQIKQNANRAANLTRQLLAFSRKQTLQPKVLSITDIVTDLSNLIRRLLGERVELKMSHERGLGQVKADAGQIEQVIVNLAVNARDAMPDGGVLSISTANLTLAADRRIDVAVMPKGDYVQISVVDTGTGIPIKDLDKIFEPFFTTKEVGQGTGLGLSTVYGIIKQSDGFVEVQSQPGKGTSFHIYLPVCAATDLEARPAPQEATPRDLTGSETILLVEDEAGVRLFAERALSNKGYKVLSAADGEQALEILDTFEGEVALVISDVVMPNMDGPTMVAKAIKSRPDMKVIFMSGYADDAFQRGLDENLIFDYLPKPFSLSVLAERVKDVLENDQIDD